MKDETFQINVPGKFSEIEESILDYLYAHPDDEIGTKELMQILKPEQSSVEQSQKAYETTQYGVETLIAAGLAKGKRVLDSENINHCKLQLSQKGEAEAIRQKRRTKNIVVHVETMGGDPVEEGQE